MADTKKPRHEEEDDSDDECIVEDMGSDDEDPGGEDDDEMEVNEEVQVDFEGLSISDNDFHGIRQMLQQLFPKDNINISEISNILIGQNFIGSVLKQSEVEDDESDDSEDVDQVLGVTSCISCNGMHKPNVAINNLMKFLIQKCEKYATDGKTKTEFKKLLESKKEDSCLGWIVNERFINIPPQISLPMFEKLRLEIGEAQSGKHKNSYDFSHYFMICKTYNSKEPEEGKKFVPEKLEFINSEEELFSNEALFKFSYPLVGAPGIVTGKWDDDAEEMQPSRTILVLTKEKISNVIENLGSSLTV